MFKLIEFLKKRPSDLVIRLIRTLASLAIAAILAYVTKDYVLPFEQYYSAFVPYVHYGLAGIFVLHALLFGVAGICLCKRGLMRKIQIVSGLLLMTLGIMTSTVTAKAPIIAPSESVSISELAKPKESAPIHVGGWIVLYGIFAIIAGISGKMITQKCYKYGEIITKIRV